MLGGGRRGEWERGSGRWGGKWEVEREAGRGEGEGREGKEILMFRGRRTF